MTSAGVGQGHLMKSLPCKAPVRLSYIGKIVELRFLVPQKLVRLSLINLTELRRVNECCRAGRFQSVLALPLALGFGSDSGSGSTCKSDIFTFFLQILLSVLVIY